MPRGSLLDQLRTLVRAAETKTEDGHAYPASAFAYVPDPESPSTWKLRLENADGDLDATLVGAAAAALGPGYRGQTVDLPDGDRAAVVAKVRAAWTKLHPDAADDEMPDGIKKSAEPDSGDVHVDGLLPGQKPKPPKNEDDPPKKSAAELSHEELRDRISAAINAMYGAAEAYGCCWVCETYDDRVVYQAPNGRYFQIGYADAEDNVTLEGEPVEVRTSFVPVRAASERHNLIDLAAYRARQHRRDAALFVDARGFAEPPEWMPCLPVPGSYAHPNWGDIEITAERNQRFVSNFNGGVYQRDAAGKPAVPVNAEHLGAESGAVGWIDELRLNADGSVDGHVAWTDRGRTMIEEDRFKFVSPEWWDEWTDPATGTDYQDVLIGAAICTRPFFKDNANGTALRPLVASEGRLYEPENTAPADPATKQEGEMPDPITEPTATGAQEPKVDEPKGAAEPRKPKTMAELEAENASLRTAIESAQAAAKEAREGFIAIRTEARRKRFTDEVMGRSEENGLRWFGEVGKHVETLETLADKLGEDSDAFKQYVEVNRTSAKQVREMGAFSERGAQGAGPDDPVAKVTAMARERAAKDEISEADAMAKVFSENPSLYREYTERTQVKV